MTQMEEASQKISPHPSLLPNTCPAKQEAGMEAWETDWSRDVLERIVALLVSLAGLADLAAGLPAARRRHLLGILSVGEAEAHAFLIGSGAPVSVDGQDTAGDALRLAARLRALAMLLIVLVAQGAQVALPGAAAPHDGREKPAEAGFRASLSAPDTS
jgi:hypothetical protein